jgi:hypothetical protein
MTKDLDNKARARFGSTARFVRKRMEIFVVAGDNPAALGLPVVIIYQHF